MAYPLPGPIESGSLMMEEVYFAREWHSILILEVKMLEQNLFLVLDVTDPQKFKNQQSLLSSDYFVDHPFKPLSKPSIICSEEGEWGFIIGGKIGQEGAIYIIPFESSTKERQIKIGKNIGFRTLVPIDLYARGYVDIIYAVDDLGYLWVIDFKSFKTFSSHSFKKLSQKPVLTGSQKICVVNSASQHGLELLAIEKSTEKDNENLDSVVCLLDKHGYGRLSENIKREKEIGKQEEATKKSIKQDEPNEPKKADVIKQDGSKEQEDLLKQVLAKGRYLDFFLSAGYLFLVPKEANQKPELMSRTQRGYEKTNATWQSVVCYPLQAELIWDAQQKQIKVLTIDQDGQLSILQPNYKADSPSKGRAVWRRNVRQD